MLLKQIGMEDKLHSLFTVTPDGVGRSQWLKPKIAKSEIKNVWKESRLV